MHPRYKSTTTVWGTELNLFGKPRDEQEHYSEEEVSPLFSQGKAQNYQSTETTARRELTTFVEVTYYGKLYIYNPRQKLFSENQERQHLLIPVEVSADGHLVFKSDQDLFVTETELLTGTQNENKTETCRLM